MFTNIIVGANQGEDDTSLMDLAGLLADAGAEIQPSSASPAGLHRLARERHADLLVVGGGHRGAWMRMRLGDGARSVLRSSPCPVAIVSVGWAAPARPLRVGVGYDGSVEADWALAMARELNRHAGAELSARYVLSLTELPYGEWPASKAVKLAARVAARHSGPSDPLSGFECATVCGDPTRELAHYSRRIDLLIVGSRGISGLDRALLGSTTDRLSTRIHCPMLVLPRCARDGDQQPEPGRRELLPDAPTDDVFSAIVIGDDGGPAGRDAVALATELAGGAALTSVRVGTEELVGIPQGAAGPDARVSVISPSVAGGLQQAAEARDAELIVLGSMPRSKVATFLVRDYAQAAAPGARRAIALAPAGYSGAKRSFAKIGVAHDRTTGGAAAVVIAQRLAERFGASLSARTIVDVPPLPGTIDPRFGDDGAMGGVPTVRISRNVAPNLIAYAETVDLMIFGCGRYGTLGRFVNGSLSDELLHEVACPVLVVGAE